jgi:hypothetical protein
MSSLLTFPAFSPALLPGESREELESLLDAYLDEYKPSSITEEHCVCQLADAEWRLRRLRRAHTSTPSSDSTMRQDEDHLLRLYNRALDVMLKLRKERRAEESYIARLTSPTAAEEPLFQRASQTAP